MSQALLDAKLDLDCAETGQMDKARAGVLVGSAMGGMQTFSTAIETLHKQVIGASLERLGVRQFVSK